MAITITNTVGGFYHGVWTGATYHSYVFFTAKNSGSVRAKLKSITFYCAALTYGYYIQTTLVGAGGGFTMYATCNGVNSNTVTISKTYSGMLTSNVSGYDITLTFSQPVSIPAGASYDIKLTFGNTTYQVIDPDFGVVRGSIFLKNDNANPTCSYADLNFAWTSNDAANIVAGKPVTNITAAKWNEFNGLIKANIDSSYTYTTVSAGGTMTRALIKQPADKLGVTIDSAATIKASYFTALKDKYNAH